jgi:hypothetical protein
MLISLDDGKELTIGQYVFVKGGKGNKNYPWIAKIIEIYVQGHPKLGVLWTYHPRHPRILAGTRGVDFGPSEILLSDNEDTVNLRCVIGFAQVEENCENCKEAQHWCWNRRHSTSDRKIISEGRPTKRRRVSG